MPQHTDGEWYLTDEDGYFRIRIEGVDDFFVAEIPHFPESLEEDRANFTLMAQAPRMLALIRELWPDYSMWLTDQYTHGVFSGRASQMRTIIEAIDGPSICRHIFECEHGYATCISQFVESHTHHRAECGCRVPRE